MKTFLLKIIIRLLEKLTLLRITINYQLQSVLICTRFVGYNILCVDFFFVMSTTNLMNPSLRGDYTTLSIITKNRGLLTFG